MRWFFERQAHRVLPGLLAIGLIAVAPAPDPQIDAMRNRFAAVAERLRAAGVDPVDYVVRLTNLDARIANAGTNAPNQLRADLQTQKSLEFQLDERVLSAKPLALPTIGNATVRLYPRTGKQPDPVGIYVPQPDAAGRYALVVLLHGMGQTETDVISREVFRDLANAHHAILLAPFNDGSAAWSGAAIGELVTLVEKVRRLYPIDGRRVYLVGMSMGGSSVFHIAATEGDRFAAFMTIVGSLDPSDAPSARLRLRTRNVYMVSGGADPIVTPAIEASSVDALANGCVPVSQYVAPNASHDFYGTAPEIEQAWNDMFAGIVRNDNTRECSETPGGIAP